MAESNPRKETASGADAHEEDGIPIEKLMGRIKGLMLDTDANGFLWSEPSDTPSLAEKPKRDLKGKRFAGLRDEPWKFSLAVEMTLFARSDDASPGGTWPYEKFQDRIEAQGHFLPDGLSIEAAVNVVEHDLLRMSPATPKKPAWYEANIEIPMHRRRTSGLMGAASKDEGEGVEYVPSWLQPSTHDFELEQAVVTFHDIQRAPALLRARLASVESRTAEETGPAEAAHQSLTHRLRALRAAIVLAEAIASGLPTRDEMHTWLRDALDVREDISRDPREWEPSTSPLVIDAAGRAKQVDPLLPEFSQHCRLVADEYIEALRCRDIP